MKKSIFVALAIMVASNLSAMQVWPIFLDETSRGTVQEYFAGDFQPNEVDQFLYLWDGTYTAGVASGKNFYGNNDGYVSLVVGGAGWSGAGFCLTADGTGWEAAKALKEAIVANPSNYYLHLAIKSTDNYSHCFYLFGSESTKFVLGSKSVYDGPVYANFERDGEWHDFYIPMTQFANALANQAVEPGVNVFVHLSEGVQGAQLNYDAVYFCDADFKENNPLTTGDGGGGASESKTLTINYLDKSKKILDNEIFVFHFPEAPAIDGFKFLGWQPVAELIEDAIEIQAVYKSLDDAAPAVVHDPANAARKLVRQGNVYILTGDKTFSVSGKRVE